MSGLVIYTPNWLGDSILSRPAVASLLQAHRAGDAVAVAHPRVAPLWCAWPGLRVIETQAGSWLADAWSTGRKLRASGRWERGYLFSASFRSAAALALGGVRQRVGFAAGGRSFLLTDPVARVSAGQMHYSEEFFHLLPDCAARVEAPDWQWPDAARDRADELLAEHGLKGVEYVAVAPGSAGAAKRYPAALWREVLRIVAPQVRVVLVGTAAEAAWAHEAAATLGAAVTNLCGATNLGALAQILVHAAGFAGADSGAAHLAAALGCPTLALFGPGDPVETAPRGHRVVVLRDGLWCSPCRSRRCLRPEAPSECMDRIPPAQVAAALLGKLRGRGL